MERDAIMAIGRSSLLVAYLLAQSGTRSADLAPRERDRANKKAPLDLHQWPTISNRGLTTSEG
jgi:hypothetical protein